MHFEAQGFRANRRLEFANAYGVISSYNSSAWATDAQTPHLSSYFEFTLIVWLAVLPTAS